MNITNANTNNENANKGAANHPSNAKEALVQKLQGVLQELRQERDQLHRSKELALERCRLVREEEQSLSKIVASLKEKKEKLQKAALEIKAGLGPVEASVQETTKQMQFQHSELLGAREKIQQTNRSMEQSAKEREHHMLKAQQLVFLHREKLEEMQKEEQKIDFGNLNKNDELSLAQQKEGLARELSTSMIFEDDHWTTLLPKLMADKAAVVKKKSKLIRQEAERMDEVMARYGYRYNQER